MATFLLKAEPEEFSFADLIRERRAAWDGLTNPTACLHLRKARAGDEALIYHTGDERAIVGLARIVSDAYSDPVHGDARTAAGELKYPVVDIEPVVAAPKPVTLAAIKADPRFASFALVTQSRLGAMPVPDDLDRVVRTMAGLPAPAGAAPAPKRSRRA
jgi:predicted RNA-binding protein with PUA-like domain